MITSQTVDHLTSLLRGARREARADEALGAAVLGAEHLLDLTYVIVIELEAEVGLALPGRLGDNRLEAHLGTILVDLGEVVSCLPSGP